MTCRAAVLLFVIAVAPLPALNAQAADCTYDTCALRIQHTFWQDRLVSGIDARVIARLSAFAPHIETLATAGDSVRNHYQAFRTAQNTGGVLNILSAAVAIVWAFSVADGSFYDPRPEDYVLMGGSLALGIAGTLSTRSGRNHLTQSIWHYNRGLPK